MLQRVRPTVALVVGAEKRTVAPRIDVRAHFQKSIRHLRVLIDDRLMQRG